MQDNKDQHFAKEILAQKCMCLYLPRTSLKCMTIYVLWLLYSLQWRKCQIKMQSLPHIQMVFNVRSPTNWNKWRSDVLVAMVWAMFHNYSPSRNWEMNLTCFWVRRKLELDIEENTEGIIYTGVSQRTILVKKRFKRFGGLVGDENIKYRDYLFKCGKIWRCVAFSSRRYKSKYSTIWWKLKNSNKK